MGSNNSKIKCIWLPGQSGKTRKIEENIKLLNEISKLYKTEGYLNILICSNNRTLVKQTNSRMKNNLYSSDEDSDIDSVLSEDDEQANSKVKGNVFSWLSGNKNNNIAVGDLADKIKEEQVNMVVCCANKKRLQYLKDLILNLENSRYFNKKIAIYIDEADASIKLWSREEFNVSIYTKVKQIILVSATYDSIIKKYGRINLIPFENTHPDVYYKLEDCNIVEKDYIADNAFEYLQISFKKYKETLCKPGVCLFAPGDIERVSHNNIANFLQNNGFIVVILNGERKEIVLLNGSTINLNNYMNCDNDNPEEIGRIIAKFYHDNEYYKHPFAITGQLCLGRGITFQNELFMFHFGIIFTIEDEANAYQCACRMLGNIKQHHSFKQSTLITTSKMKKVIIEKEMIAINISKIAYEKNLTEIGKEEILLASGKEDEYNNEMKKEVPVVINTNSSIINMIKRSSSADKQKIILEQLINKYKNYEYLNLYECNKISFPDPEKYSYKRHVTDLIKWAETNRRGMVDTGQTDMAKNIWQAFIDIRENRIILMIYHGFSLPKKIIVSNPF